MRYRFCMASIQIRDVPPNLHAELKRRAAAAGVSLQEYLLGEIEEIVATPTIDEVIERARSRGLYQFEESSADALAAIRREREEHLGDR